MAKINRFNGDLKAFGSQATGLNRTVFESTSQSDLLDDNINTAYLVGWENTTTNEAPAKQDFNALGFTHGQLLAYLHQVGVAEWDSSGEQEYHADSFVNRNGVIFVCKTDNHTSLTAPELDTANWKNILSGGEVATIEALLTVDPLFSSTAFVKDYHSDTDGGGDVFVWDATAVKNTHNGGTIIDPDVTYPTLWSDLVQLQAWFDGSINTTLGCWVRKYKSVYLSSFGVISGDESAADSNKIAMNAARASTSLLLGSEGDIYYMPPETTVSSSGLILDMMGATIKQVSGIHDLNWLLVTDSNGFKLRNAIIDGNRLGATGLSIDRSLVTIFNTEDVDIVDCVVKESAAKGLSVTSSLTGTGTRRIRLKNVTAYSCEEQCIMVESTGTPDCEDVTMSGCIVKDTSHAGIALNDGARRVTLTNCIVDVNNSVWDAISVRGASNITITNCIGRRGRSGCRLFILDQPALDRGEDCRNITMSGNIWEYNSQAGIQIEGAENISIGMDIARNNDSSAIGYPGINISQRAGVRRANRISLASVQAFDDQVVPTQERGIYVSAADNVKVSSPIIYGNVISNRVDALSGSGIVGLDVTGDGPDGATHKMKSQTTGEIPAGGRATVTVTFDTPFDLLPNWANAEVLFGSAAPYLRVQKISGLNSSVINVDVYNDTATAATGDIFVEARVLS